MESGQRAKKLLQYQGQCMNFPTISSYSVQPGLTFSMGLMLCPQLCLSHNFLLVLQMFARVISVL